ncbi:MAG: hypothetical protein JRJ87_01375 [Deltaproteobacteria bacterium]|nr:hypothetical protein [Deltaproteobacteria bacterium]
MFSKSHIAGLIALLGLTSCGGSSGPTLPEPQLWPNPEVILPSASIFDRQAWLLDVSSWSGEGCGTRQPTEARYMGDFAVANGHVFSLSGYTCPLNSLHTMVGPDYQQESEFFRDTYLKVLVNAEPVKITSGHMFRVSKTAILISRESSEKLELITITFAPKRTSLDDPLNRSIVRIAIVKNLSSETIENIVLQTASGSTVREGRQRTLVLLEPQTGNPDQLDLGSLAADQETTVIYSYVMSKAGDGEAATIAALQQGDIEVILQSTRDNWLAFVDQAARLESPDPRVDDLLSGMLVTVKSQQTYLGGVSPMSRYTLMWIRDTAGPVRFFLRMGLFDQARAMLDYYFTAAKVRGDISNAVDLDIDPETPPTEPDWASLPPFSGRAAGEIPSYLPIMGHWFTLASSDRSLVEAQYGLYKRCLLAQQLDENGLLPFSGDETYRGAMGMAFGLAIEHDFVGCCKSANSSFLLGAAAEALAQEADALGHAADAQTFRDKGALVRQAADQIFWRNDDMYAPYLDMQDLDNLPQPFEDVSTKPLWTGYADANDQLALTNLENVIARLATKDGFLQSPLDPFYDNYLELEISQGVYTGMMPGYYLYNLAITDHPLGEKAFNALELAASPSGNFAEYQVYDDHSALQPIYDPGGTLGDLTARYRPWEGSISLDSMVFYLTGLIPDAPLGAVELAPRLVNDWPQMKWTNLRVGDQRFDLLVEELGGKRRVTVTPTSAGSLDVHLSVPLGEVSIERVEVNGAKLDPEAYEIFSPFGLTRIMLGTHPTSQSAPLIATVEYSSRS